MNLYVRSDSVVSRVIAGETLVVPISKGVGDLASIYSLNPVASAIWEVISSPHTEDEIIRTVEREFAAERRRIESDVKAFLFELKSVGLITEIGVAASS